MKKTAYLTPDIREMDMDAEELLAYSVNGESLVIATTEDNINDGNDNRSRGFDLWDEDEL